jgi:hypothetical protein
MPTCPSLVESSGHLSAFSGRVLRAQSSDPAAQIWPIETVAAPFRFQVIARLQVVRVWLNETNPCSRVFRLGPHPVAPTTQEIAHLDELLDEALEETFPADEVDLTNASDGGSWHEHYCGVVLRAHDAVARCLSNALIAAKNARLAPARECHCGVPKETRSSALLMITKAHGALKYEFSRPPDTYRDLIRRTKGRIDCDAQGGKTLVLKKARLTLDGCVSAGGRSCKKSARRAPAAAPDLFLRTTGQWVSGVSQPANAWAGTPLVPGR